MNEAYRDRCVEDAKRRYLDGDLDAGQLEETVGLILTDAVFADRYRSEQRIVPPPPPASMVPRLRELR